MNNGNGLTKSVVIHGQPMSLAKGGRLVSCLAMFLFLCSGVMSYGQSTSGITGTVTDSSGAVVADAVVTATNTATGVVSHGVTSSAGSFIIVDLIPGTYTVRIRSEAC